MTFVEEKVNDPNFETHFKASVCKSYKVSDEDCSTSFEEIKKEVKTKSARSGGYGGGYDGYNKKSKVVIIKENERRRDHGLRDILPLLLIPLLTNRNNVPPVIPERNRDTIDPLLLALLAQRQQQQQAAQTTFSNPFFPGIGPGTPTFINVPPGICRVFFNCINCQC
jgi:hypothetical protein